MASAPQAKLSRLKVREYRGCLRAKGMRPIQLWVPGLRAPAFRAEVHRQSLAVAKSAQADEDQAFIAAPRPTTNEAG